MIENETVVLVLLNKNAPTALEKFEVNPLKVNIASLAVISNKKQFISLQFSS